MATTNYLATHRISQTLILLICWLTTGLNNIMIGQSLEWLYFQPNEEHLQTIQSRADANGYIYSLIGDEFPITYGSNGHIVKQNSSGTVLWNTPVYGAVSIAIDSQGNTFVLAIGNGLTNNAGTFSKTIRITKFDPTGTQIASAIIGSNCSGDCTFFGRPIQIEVDHDDNVLFSSRSLLAGYIDFDPSESEDYPIDTSPFIFDNEYIITKWSNGLDELQWSLKLFGEADSWNEPQKSSGQHSKFSIAADNTVFAACNHHSSIILHKIDPDGSTSTSNEYAITGFAECGIGGLTVTGNQLVIAGTFIKEINLELSSPDAGPTLTSNFNHIWLGGVSSSEHYLQDGFIAAYDFDFNLLWFDDAASEENIDQIEDLQSWGDRTYLCSINVSESTPPALNKKMNLTVYNTNGQVLDSFPLLSPYPLSPNSVAGTGTWASSYFTSDAIIQDGDIVEYGQLPFSAIVWSRSLSVVNDSTFYLAGEYGQGIPGWQWTSCATDTFMYVANNGWVTPYLAKYSIPTAQPSPIIADSVFVCRDQSVQFTLSNQDWNCSSQWTWCDGTCLEDMSNWIGEGYTYTATFNESDTLEVCSFNTDGLGQCANIVVHVPEIPSFTVDTNYFPSPPASPVFNNTSTPNSNIDYEWIWWDGTSEYNNAAEVTHTYQNSGTFSVELIAHQASCSTAFECSFCIQVDNPLTTEHTYSQPKKTVGTYDILGRPIDEQRRGIIIEVFDDGSVTKTAHFEQD